MIMVAVFVIGFIIVNGMQSKAATSYPYLIKVNKQQNCVTIYKKDDNGKYTVPVKAMTCSTGYDTPSGTFRTPQKIRWHVLMGDVWGQYCTRINKGVLFHSVWYYEKDPSTLSGVQYNKLGTTASHGCVRLSVADAKWIYDNCAVGTTVKIYSSADPGPLGKPEAIKVPNTKGWDPTDISYRENPYNKKKPSIKGATNQTIEYGVAVNLKKNVTAKNTTGYSITKNIKTVVEYNGKKVKSVNSQVPGKYTVTYKVTDEMKRTASKTVTIIVKEDTSAPTLVGVKDLLVKGGVTIDHDFVMKNVSAKQGGVAIAKKNITAKITKKSESLYLVEYSVTGPNGKSVTAKAKVTVDSEAPVLSGITDKEIAWDTTLDNAFALNGVTVTDNYSQLTQKNIKVSITDNKDNTFTITYTASDEVGNVIVEEAIYTITDFLKIEGAKDLTIPVDIIVDAYFVSQQGIKAYNGTTDITSQMTVTISEKVNDQYKVTFTVMDQAGHKEEITVTYTLEKATVAPSPSPTTTPIA